MTALFGEITACVSSEEHILKLEWFLAGVLVKRKIPMYTYGKVYATHALVSYMYLIHICLDLMADLLFPPRLLKCSA